MNSDGTLIFIFSLIKQSASTLNLLITNYELFGDIPNVLAAGVAGGFCFFSLRICEDGMVAEAIAADLQPCLPATPPQPYCSVITATDYLLPIWAKDN